MLVNLLISHPDVCISDGEIHKVFKGTARTDNKWSTRRKKLTRDYPIRLLTGQNIFRAGLLEDRKNISPILKRYIDFILYHGRFRCLLETHNLYKAEGEEYTKSELSNCRLLTKGVNGLVFTADIFAQMYPDANHFALVRNGLAICEGRLRRGNLSASELARHYKIIVNRMLINQERIPNFHIVKYEDMVSNPLEFIRTIYTKADINFDDLRKVRLESKPVMDQHGTHQLNKGYDHQLFWYPLEELHQHIRTDINKNQINQLKQADKDDFLATAGQTMEKLGYPIH